MKIGFTQCPTCSNENSRMEEIKRKFKDEHGKDVAVIFVLMKNAVDAESHHDFEVRIRKHVGSLSRKIMPSHKDYQYQRNGF